MFITTEVIIDAELGAERALSLCQKQQVIAPFGTPRRCLERLWAVARSGATARIWSPGGSGRCSPSPVGLLSRVCEQQRINRPGLLPLRVQFVGAPQVGVEMLDFQRREHAREDESMHSLGQQIPCLLVEGDGIAHRYYPHRLIA